MDEYLPHSKLADMDTQSTPQDIQRIKQAAMDRATRFIHMADKLALIANQGTVQLASERHVLHAAAEEFRQLSEGR